MAQSEILSARPDHNKGGRRKHARNVFSLSHGTEKSDARAAVVIKLKP
jgi:hypothetical protein